jgi:glycosyltransferase involved in cell wall biosynthesis
VIIASEIDMAIYSKYFCHLPAILDELQIGVPYQKSTQTTSPGLRFRNSLTWMKHRRYVASILKNFQTCVVASGQERQLLSQIVPDYQSIEVVPNCVNLAEYHINHELTQPNSLIFTGSFRFSANYEAMLWFLSEVYPHIQNQVPNVHLTITGDHANLPLPPADNLTLAGFVDDVKPLIASSWVSLAPLRIGGGTRLKILEAMALGTPVVATSKGAEGLDVTPGEHLLIADTPEDFSTATIRLLTEPGLRQRLAANAYRLVSEKYDWDAVMPQFLSLVDRVACARPG